MLKFKKILAFSMVAVSLFSCRKDFERPNWDVDLLAPLIKTTLNLQDLLPDSVLQTNLDTSLKLVYQTNIFDIDMDSLFKIPDTTITEIYNVPVNSIANPGNSFYSNDEERTMNVSNGVELNYVMVETGSIEIQIFSEIKEKIMVTYTIPSAITNGDTLELQVIIPAGTIAPSGYFIRTIDLSGYELDLTGISMSEVTTIITRAIATVDTNAAGPVNIVAGEKITYQNKLMGIVPYFVRGYFGQQQLHFGPETTNTTAFNQITSGTLDLEQVDVNIEFKME